MKISELLNEGKKYKGSHFEVSFKGKNGEETFTVIQAMDKEEAKQKFKKKHSEKIISVRGTGVDVNEGGEQAEHDSRSLLCTCAASKGQPHSRKCPQYRKPIAPAKKSVTEAGPEWIKHPTQKGVMVKNPRWEPPMHEPKVKSGLNRSEAMKARHAALKAKYDKLYHFIFMAIGNSFPDGDPSDTVVPYARRLFDLDEWADPWNYINKAVKMHEPFKSLTEWMASMWDETAADRVFDANNSIQRGLDPDEVEREFAPFVYLDTDNNTAVPAPNPWK